MLHSENKATSSTYSQFLPENDPALAFFWSKGLRVKALFLDK
jgi:hypothetical protein